MRGCEPLLDVQRLLRAQWAGDVRPAKAREQLLGADIAQGGAAGHPRLQGLDVAQRIGKHVEHQLERAIDSLFGIDGFLDALGANLGEPQFEGLGLRRRNRLDDAEDTVSCRVCNAPIS